MCNHYKRMPQWRSTKQHIKHQNIDLTRYSEEETRLSANPCETEILSTAESHPTERTKWLSPSINMMNHQTLYSSTYQKSSHEERPTSDTSVQ